MKTILRYLIPVAGLAAAWPLLRAEEPPPADQKDLRVIVGPDDTPPPPASGHHLRRLGAPLGVESVTFLGIETRPADATLADQLSLPKNTGLIVRNIVPDSPAASVLKRNDVLVRLDDQVLIEQRQLSVLVRNHRDGDEVVLTYIRGGKEATAKVKLTKHEVPKMALMMDAGSGAPSFGVGPDDEGMAPGFGREDMDRVLALIDNGQPGPQQRRIRIGRDDTPGMQSTTVSTSNSNMVFSDDKGSLDLTIKDGQKTLIAKNAKGEQLFSGPVTTPEQRKALPPEIRERLDKLEGMQEFSFRTDDDFQGGNTQVVQPRKTKILLPSQAPSAPIPPVPAF
jgi:hypothetical protein